MIDRKTLYAQYGDGDNIKTLADWLEDAYRNERKATATALKAARVVQLMTPIMEEQTRTIENQRKIILEQRSQLEPIVRQAARNSTTRPYTKYKLQFRFKEIPPGPRVVRREDV